MKLSPRYTRHCETCGNVIKITKYELMRGKGIYCSIPCRDYTKKSISKLCKTCKMPFKTTDPTNIHCCDECKDYAI